MENKFSKFINLQGKYLTSLLILLALSLGQMWAADFTPAQITASGGTTTSNVKVSSPLSTTSAKVCNESVTCVSIGGSANGNYDASYVEIQASSGYTLDSPIDLSCSVNKTDDGTYKAVVVFWTGEASATYSDYTEITLRRKDATTDCGPVSVVVPSNTRTVRIYRNLKVKDGEVSGASGCTTLGSGQTTYIKAITASATAAGGDETAPTLSSSDPANSATDVAVSGTIVLTFSENIASVDDTKFSLSGATIGTVAIDGSDATKVNVPYSGAANSATVTLSVAAEAVADAAGNKSAELSDIAFTTIAAVTPACPSGLSVSGTAAYTEGETISLTAALEAGNGEITYNWYKGADLATAKAAGSIGTGASFSKASCATSDAGNYFCVATKATCPDAESAAYAVTVSAVSYCAELIPATSGSTIEVGDVIDLQSGSIGGTITAINLGTGNLAYNANGLGFNSKSGPTVKVVLNHNMQVGTKLWIKLMAAGADTRGLTLKTKTGSTISAFTCWVKDVNGATNGDVETFTYTVVAGDGLEGTNEFQLARNNSVWLQSLKVSNCGAELLDLSSAVDPVGEATVTLSANKVIAGGSATATYTISDPTAYDFDEWVISSGDATIADAHAATAAITMGTTAATITLKLKAAGTKYAVHFDSKGGSAVADQMVDEGGHATVPTAPTKFKYTFGGWSETDGGSTPANLAEIAINAEKTFYAIWTDKVCPTSGEIYSLVADPTKAPGSNAYYPTTKPGVADLAIYATVSGGLAQSIQTTSSNNSVQIQSSTAAMKISADNSIVRALLECPLQEGDTIKLVKDNKLKITFDSVATSAKTIQLASGVGENKDYYVVEAKFAGMDTIHVRKDGSNVSLTSLKVIRPAKYAVTFNMHGHGTQVEQQNIISGGKVTEPATTDITGWDFGGWYKTYVAEPESYSDAWDFANDEVSAAVELHAKWTEHVASNDVALGTLSVNGEAITIVPSQTVYAVELPMGTSDIPTVLATANDVNAKACTVTQATAVDGSASIYIKAEDDATEATYTINFSVATSKDIQLVFKTGTTPCVGSASTATQILSNNAAVSTYINQVTFTNVEGSGDDGAEGGSLNVGKKAGNMFTLSAKPGYAFQKMNFLGKIQDATCEYSTDGSDWTTLTSTNTGGDDCYQPFSGTEVHEFRLRSTGEEGVWIRNMQLTMIEACTPVVLAWDAEPVEFEVGKAGYAIAATANTGGTVTYGTLDNTIIDVVEATGALTVSKLGAVALTASAPAGDGTTYCSVAGEISKLVNTYYLVTFDPQNETGSVDEHKYFSGDPEIALPSAPSYPGHTFKGWFDAASGGTQLVEDVLPTASRTIYAQWTTDCAGPTIVEHPEDVSYFTGRTASALACLANPNVSGKALTYTWYSCDDALRTNPVLATATPSTAAVGTFYYFCAVTEEDCATVAYSDVAVITVSDKDPICLVKAELAAGESAASITSTSGYYKDDANIAININSDLKLGTTGKYVKVAVEGTIFRDGDVVEITLASDKTASAWLQIFADEGTTLVAEMTSGVTREHPNYLTISSVPANTAALYLYRTATAGGSMNPYPTSMAVYRTSAPILNKVTVAGVEGTPDNTNHVAIEVPFSTTDAALSSVAIDWISNNAAWDAAHDPAVANTWEFGVENTVTLTDKDGESSVYYVTISKAVASTNVELATLTVDGNAVDIVPGQDVYNYELPYGSAAPTVAATAEDSYATVGTITQAASATGSATFTVTAEDGTTTRDYTINFSISKWAEVVIWDGSTMDAVATSPGALGLTWEVVAFDGVKDATNGYKDKAKAETKMLVSNGASPGKHIHFVIPAGYVAKFYTVFASHSESSERGFNISTELAKNPTSNVYEASSVDKFTLVSGISEIVGSGDVYFNPNNSIDFYEIRAYLRPGYKRIVSNNIGTLCVNHNVAAEDLFGATYYQIAGLEPEYGKIAFDEVTELVAGEPYIFRSNVGSIWMFYGDDVAPNPVKVKGMVGSFNGETLDITDENKANIMYIAQNKLWNCEDLVGVGLEVVANRCYIEYSKVPPVPSPNPAPGRRRVSIGGANVPSVATDIDNLNSSEKPVKLLIDGQLFIIRGEKMFDATGRLVK